MNTRLQVEHGVTEEVFGVDLVEWMVRLGAGDELPLNKERTPKGHSIQARIYAEDPVKNFQPCAGLLSRVDWQAKATDGMRTRIDTWVESGTQVPALFDPMLAKVIVTADDRASAIQGLAETLDQSELYGIETNLLYLKSILKDEEVKAGLVWTQKLNKCSSPTQPLM